MDHHDLDGELTVDIATPSGGPTSAGVWNVAVSGDLDLASAPKLIEALDVLIGQGASLIVLDASAVQFMDSSGIRAIVQCGQRLRAAGGQLLIDGMSGAVQRVLEISGLLEQYRA